jgi:hypothetical protein
MAVTTSMLVTASSHLSGSSAPHSHSLETLPSLRSETEQMASCCYLQSSSTYNPNPGVSDSPYATCTVYAFICFLCQSYDPKEEFLLHLTSGI